MILFINQATRNPITMINEMFKDSIVDDLR